MNLTQEMMDKYEALKQHHREHHTELAEKDAEIERLQMQYGFEKDARRMAELEIDSLKAAAEAFSRKIAGLPD